MPRSSGRYVYGPVPSRRLGRSLGIDLVPRKICTYDCTYCQLGRTTDRTVARRDYVDIEALLGELEQRLAADPLPPDYIGVAGSGEPTLHAGIGSVIAGIKGMTTVPVAVLTNGSLLWMPEVQQALMAADVVLPSLDAGDARLFERVNRPHPDISFNMMLEGLVSFTKHHPGQVWLEVLLLAGISGTPVEAAKIAALAGLIDPNRVQLNTVCRPPADPSARSLSDEELERLRALFLGQVDIISGVRREVPASDQGPPTGRDDVLELLRRRPCTVEDVAAGLCLHVNEALKQLDALVKAGAVAVSPVKGGVFYTTTEV